MKDIDKLTHEELLTYAGKLVGIKADKAKDTGGGWYNTGFDLAGSMHLDCYNNITWNPIKRNHDAFTLQNKTQAIISHEGNCVRVRIWKYNIADVEVVENYKADLPGGYCSDESIDTATRLALTKAAASVGIQMKKRGST